MISAVIPTLNEGRFLEKCLSYLAAQKPKIELVVVDGGSTDNTLEIAKKYTRKVYNLRKRGIGIARYFGAQKAHGKYIYMTDADCWPRPCLLDNMRREMEARNVVAVTGPTKYYGINGKIMQAWYYFYDKHYFRFKYGTIGLSGRNTLIRKEMFLAALKDMSMPNFWEDGFITFALMRQGRFLYDDKLSNFSYERRMRDPLTLINTIRTYMRGMDEMKRKGSITSFHLPLTGGRVNI